MEIRHVGRHVGLVGVGGLGRGDINIVQEQESGTTLRILGPGLV